MVSSTTVPALAATYAFLSGCGLLWRLTKISDVALQDSLNVALDIAKGQLDLGTRANATEAEQAVLRHLHGSRISILTFVNFLASCWLLSAVLLKALFLGRLSAIEHAKLVERLVKYVMLKVVFIGAVLSPAMPEVTSWLIGFMVMGYLRCFLGLAHDRLEALASSPSARLPAVVRTLALMVVVLASNAAWLQSYAVNLSDIAGTKGEAGPEPFLGGTTSRMCLWLYDAAIISVEAIHTLLRFCAHAAEWIAWNSPWWTSATGGTTDGGQYGCDYPGSGAGGWASATWEGRGAFLYHADLAHDCSLALLTLGHYWHMWWLHGLSFQLVDALLFLDMRALVMQLHRRLRGYVRYCKATCALQHSFKDASPAQLWDCGECVICREHMSSAKVLSCGHVFHLGCLRAWLQQSGGTLALNCPLCRAPLLPTAPGPPADDSTQAGAGGRGSDLRALLSGVFPTRQLSWQFSPWRSMAADGGAAGGGGVGGGDAFILGDFDRWLQVRSAYVGAPSAQLDVDLDELASEEDGAGGGGGGATRSGPSEPSGLERESDDDGDDVAGFGPLIAHPLTSLDTTTTTSDSPGHYCAGRRRSRGGDGAAGQPSTRGADGGAAAAGAAAAGARVALPVDTSQLPSTLTGSLATTSLRAASGSLGRAASARQRRLRSGGPRGVGGVGYGGSDDIDQAGSSSSGSDSEVSSAAVASRQRQRPRASSAPAAAAGGSSFCGPMTRRRAAAAAAAGAASAASQQ